MKIAILAPCLEHGRDGIGDYSHGLAKGTRENGHSVFLVGLSDRFVSTPTKQPSMIRLPAAAPWRLKAQWLKAELEAFSPDVVSLQFVCYGFHPKGFCWPVADYLRQALGKTPVHLMLHELWLGAERSATLKDRLIGWVQRRCVLNLFSKLNIHKVYTSNAAYRAVLSRNRVDAEILPLFGAIPVRPNLRRKQTNDAWRFVMFGALHPVWPPVELLAYLLGLGRQVRIEHVGQIRGGATLWWKMVRDYGAQNDFHLWGEQPPEVIAQIFADADFGIATTPWELIGKSASVAAMLEHGLPVIVNRDEVHFDEWGQEGYDPQLIKMGPDLPARLVAAQRREAHSRLPDVTKRILEAMEQARM